MPSVSVRVTKRAMDIAGSLVGLCLTAPLFPPIALAIRLDSRGPVFFTQKRAGSLEGIENGIPVVKEFAIIKFRTMQDRSEQRGGADLMQKNDPRVTRVGRLLRRMRLDEIPQFVNVLRGEMSLVGPRPERAELFKDLALAIPYFEERLRDVKPGLTGLAQVELGYTGAIPPQSPLVPFQRDLQNPFDVEEAAGALADDMRIKLLYDLAYGAGLESFPRFVATEVKILVKTLLVVLRASGR